MGFEIDFHPVGDRQRSGDAISLRFGDLLANPPQQTVVVIDGGFQDCGEALVDHVQEYYKTKRVDVAVSTHSDADHSAGLAPVLEKLEVGQLLMHQPWKHTVDIARMFKDGRVTDASVRDALRESLDNALSLERIARRKGIPIIEPFAGVSNPAGTMWVVSPDEKYYESLLPNFRGTPQAATADLRTLAQLLGGFAREAVHRVAERWDYETLTDEGVTSAENNSSAIMLIQVDPGYYALFTGDAGIPALGNALDYITAIGVDLSKLRFVQVPHHGSHHNVGPTVLNRLIGPKLTTESFVKTAFVSATSDGDAEHPSKKVMNAFRRRGAPVHATQGSKKYHFLNAPGRGWSASVALPFYNEVEED